MYYYIMPLKWELERHERRCYTAKKKRAHPFPSPFSPAHFLPLSRTRPYRLSFLSFSISLSLYPLSAPSVGPMATNYDSLDSGTSPFGLARVICITTHLQDSQLHTHISQAKTDGSSLVFRLVCWLLPGWW